MILLVFYSSSDNFQSLTSKSTRFVRVPTSIFFTKKLT
ncbi:hypothetical protein LEP1GSC166_3001 [Leptospira kirschneri]|nr:hypothetical protein LEP1GSC198_1125 [Leptospira kirschneri str. JB]EMK09997.1 hypothetical protein LEP1GSC166_3001 [Leptospira kirschneri]